jgi:hypothetical protein
VFCSNDSQKEAKMKAKLIVIGLILVLGIGSFVPTGVFAREVPSWLQANADGFGDWQNMQAPSLAVFGNYLYAGTWHWDISTDAVTAKIWRSSDGVNWVNVNETQANGAAALVAYQNYIYSGSWDGKVWRSKDGLTWEFITTDGFGDSNNGIAKFAVYKNALYASTWNNNGTEIWRTTNGTQWKGFVDAGLGDQNNNGAIASAVFNGYLYWGIGNWITGAQLWRTDGIKTEVLFTNGLGTGSGVVSALGSYDDYLYATLADATTYRILRSMNGTDWVEVNSIDSPSYWQTSSFQALQGQLYLVLENDATGLEVWRTSDGIHWEQVGFAGFGDANNAWSYWDNATTVFKSKLYIGTNNFATGGEVWQMCLMSCK